MSAAQAEELEKEPAGEARPAAWPRVPALGVALWLAAVVAALVVLGWMMWSFRGQPGDDPYITYRYAQNLAAGNGFVYNVGEQVQSTTTPLFALLLGVGAWLGLDIPGFALVINALSFPAFMAACVGLLSGVERQWRWLGLLAAMLTFVCPVTLFGLGSEMPLLMALAWASWWAASRQRWGVAAMLAGLAAVTRGDGVFVGLVIAAVYVYTHRTVSPRRWAWGAALVYSLVVAPWYLFAWFYFGSPLPATLSTKVTQGENRYTTHFFDGLGYFWTRSFDDQRKWWVPALALLALGLGYLIYLSVKRTSLAQPWGWGLLFVAGYSLLGVPRYPWYYSPLVPVAMLAIIFGARALGDVATYLGKRVLKSPQVRAALPHLGLAAGLIVPLAFGWFFFAADSGDTRPEQRTWLDIYRVAGQWIDRNTPRSATVGSPEVGILGYYSNRRIIDFSGLIQPEVAEHTAHQDDLFVLKKYLPDYIVVRGTAWLQAVGADPWTQAHYATLRTFELPYSDPATLLKKK